MLSDAWPQQLHVGLMSFIQHRYIAVIASPHMKSAHLFSP